MHGATTSIMLISCREIDLRYRKKVLKRRKMGDCMTNHFGSFMVCIFKAFFLKTLKFELCRNLFLRPVHTF